MLVRQILQLKADDGVVTIDPKAKVTEAAQLLSARKIGTVVVTENGERADGILSERDIVREIGKRGTTCLDDTVSQMMTQNVQTCSSDEQADSVLTRMTEGRFRHMPVVDGEKMIGLITLGDVVKARLSELSMEKDALEHMIMGH